MPLHHSLPEFEQTPLHELDSLAGELGVGKIFVKDESFRFGLKAFKALGASYAIYRFLEEVLGKAGERIPSAGKFYMTDNWLSKNRYTFCTATDGNHGRGVAWITRKLHQRAVIYMPSESVQSRVESIQNEGAEVVLIDGGYDKAVEQCRRDSNKNDWQMISDTSWEGYEKIPRWIQAGYITLFREVRDQLVRRNIDCVFIQGGVGALLAAGTWFFNEYFPAAKIVSVEPIGADCLLRSAESKDGLPVTIGGHASTIMAGLNCGTPSKIAWPIIQKGVDLFIAISDNYTRTAIRKYYGGKPRVISGESGAAGLAGLLAMRGDTKLHEAFDGLGLSKKSNILVLNTEGDTDPVNFDRIVNEIKG